ncbi:MAG: hypothetical protein IJK89_05220 [Clostridia bacterium]|nr:hypothetical protein [Clostridia bacterium]
MSYFYVKNGEPWVPEAINPELAKLAKAIVKTCHLSFKLQMKTTALANAMKSDDKEQLFTVMQKCMAKNVKQYNSDMSLSGAEIREIDDAFFADKDPAFFKNQLAILMDFAAINTVIEGKMFPLMSAASEKTLGKKLDQLLFFTNQDRIYADAEEEPEEEE